MAIFLTGSTGYLGSYLATGLLRGYRDPLNLLVRAKNQQEARERLWQFEPAAAEEARRSLEAVGRRWEQALGRLKASLEG